MVRLKELADAQAAAAAAFQFHYGTIKSTNQPNATVTYRKFQFHYGTIKR